VKRFGKGEFLLSIPKKKIAAPIPTTADAGRLLVELRKIGEEQNRPRIFPMLSALLLTEARRGEAAGMRWEDCDLEQRTIRIWRTYDQETTKSDKERIVGMPPQLASILREYKLADPWKGELMFPDDTGSMYKPSSKIPENTLRAALARGVEAHPRSRPAPCVRHALHHGGRQPP
jgi:integrase